MGIIRFGVFLPSYAFQTREADSAIFKMYKDVVLECEKLGYDSVWFDDHLMFAKTPILESWTLLAAIASITNRIRIGTMVTPTAFRNPALLAKMATTVDIISGGRLELGIGSGIQSEEHYAYGYSFPEFKIRTERMREAIQVIKELWTEETANFKGKYYKLANAVCEPKPIQKPHPPITIGGSGEKYTLKVTAKHANKCDFGYLPSIEMYKHKLQVLEKHCKAEGRDFEEIEKTCWPAGQILITLDKDTLDDTIQRVKPKNISRKDFEKYCLAGTPEDCKQKLQPYIDLGATDFMLYFGELPNTNSLCEFAKTVAPKIK